MLKFKLHRGKPRRRNSPPLPPPFVVKNPPYPVANPAAHFPEADHRPEPANFPKEETHGNR